jgi:hypothetical protein
MDEAQPKQKSTWADRYISISILLISLCFIAIFILGYYEGLNFNFLLSFGTDDSWCTKGTESIGDHCFGDYSLFRIIFDQSKMPTPWSGNPGYEWLESNYPAASLLPINLFVWIGKIFDSFTLGRNLYLALLAASILAPTIWVSRHQWRQRGAIAFLILGIASAPFLITLDRGNSTGLLVAPLLLAAIAYMKNQQKKMFIFIVICILLKPQMIILVLLFLVYRAFYYMALTILVSGTLSLFGFVFYNGSLVENISDWIKSVNSYNSGSSLLVRFDDGSWPSNLAIGKSTITVLNLLGYGFSGPDGVAQLITDNSTVISITVLVFLSIALLIKGKASNPYYSLVAIITATIIIPGVTSSYYTVLILVPAAFVLKNPNLGSAAKNSDWLGILDSGNCAEPLRIKIYNWVTLLAFALILTPLIIPIPNSLFTNTTPSPEYVGLLQVLYGPILLFLFLFSVYNIIKSPNLDKSKSTRWALFAKKSSSAFSRSLRSGKSNAAKSR